MKSQKRWGDAAVVEEPSAREVMVTEPKNLEVVDNRIYFYSEVDRETVLDLNKTLRIRHNSSVTEQKTMGVENPVPIYLYIQSYGGSIFSGLSAMDEVLSVRQQVPVYTIVDGCCASAATFISIVGTKRYMKPNAMMLIHQLTSSMWGKYLEFQDEMKNLDMMMEKIRAIYGTYSKVPLGKLDGILKHDLWFDLKTCLRYGLVDEVYKN